MTDHTPGVRDSAAIHKLGAAREKILSRLGQVIVGQDQVIEELLISLFSRGHCLLEGLPGLAKTLMVSTLARALNLSFSRIQFTPDLMPADITGTEYVPKLLDCCQKHLSDISNQGFGHWHYAHYYYA